MSAAAVVSYGRSHAHTTSSSPTPTPSSSTPSPPSTPTLMSLITRAASAPRALVATTNTEQKQQGQLSPSILRTTSRIATLVRTSYGLSSDEIGDRLSGHACITERDKRDAANNGHSLLFGEVLPLGVVKLCDAQHLNVAQATTVYDLGSGCGKLAMQVFLQYPHLRAVVGCELTASRASRASTAMQRLVKSRKHARVTQHEGVTRFIEPEKTQYRTLELRHQDLFACTDAWHADVVILETDLPSPQHLRLCNFLSQCKPGARVMTYLNIARIYETCRLRCPFVQMSSNGEHDRIHTSWAPNNGHRFFFWTKQHTIWTITVEHPISQHIVTQNKENLSQVSTATATATTLIPSRWESSTKKSNSSMSSSPTSSTSSSPSSPLLHVRHPSSSVDPSFIIHHDITSYPTTTRQFNISSACTVQQCLDAIMSKDASSYQLELVTDDEHHHTGVALHHATPVIRHLSLTHHPDQLTFVIRPRTQ